MMTTKLDELACEGLAARTVIAWLPQQARILVRLSAEERRKVIYEQLEYLVGAGLLTSEQARSLAAVARGDATDAPPAALPDPTGPRPLTSTVYGILRGAALARPVTESFLDDAWELAMTLGGVALGELIGGPGGALVGGAAAYQWAHEHHPSTWFT